MPKMTREALGALRAQKKKEFEARAQEGKDIEIIVGMGTCGIAAGAKQTFDAIVASLEKHNLANKVTVRQTGCMGLCYVEPTVEVNMPAMPRVIYGKMTSDMAEDLVEKHIINHSLLDNHIFDKPAIDIMRH